MRSAISSASRAMREHALQVEDVGLERGEEVQRAGEHGVVAEATRHRDRLADQRLAPVELVGEEQLGSERREKVRPFDAVVRPDRVERGAKRVDPFVVAMASDAEEPAARREHRRDLGGGVACRRGQP